MRHLALFLWIAVAAVAQVTPGPANVRDFGAVGDGGNDDTAAIQKACDSGRPVYFPAGRYKITDTLTIYAPWLYGDGMNVSEIFITDKAKDIFFVKFAWRGQVRDLGFQGGRQHLNMRNIRVDQGLMQIRDCSFRDSSDFAIWLHERSNPMHLVIRGCHFGQCTQVLFTPCDWTTVADCWITTAWMHDKAAIENRGAKLVLENIVGVPLVTGDNDRWIDNYGMVTCRNFRFGGEFGGMTPVWNFQPLSKTMAGGGVILEDCYVAAQGSGRRCAIWCEQIPNLLVVRDCILSSPVVGLSPRIELEACLKHAAPGVLRYDLQGNSTLDQEDVDGRRLLAAVATRDSSPEPVAGQLDATATAAILAAVVAKVQNLPAVPGGAEFEGRRQRTDPADYVDITPATHIWDVDEFMDSTAQKNSGYVAMSTAGDDIVFMRCAPNGPNGAWPHVMVHRVTVDLERTPFLAWRQRDPGPSPLPAGVPPRSDDEKLDEGVAMPCGYAMRVRNLADGKVVLLRETHTPPWFDYRAYDLRQVFGVEHGKLVIDVKYYPLGVYITGLPGSGFARPGEYQILDFLRLEAE